MHVFVASNDLTNTYDTLTAEELLTEVPKETLKTRNRTQRNLEPLKPKDNRKEVPIIIVVSIIIVPHSSFLTPTSPSLSGMPFLLPPFVTVSLSPSRWLCCFVP